MTTKRSLIAIGLIAAVLIAGFTLAKTSLGRNIRHDAEALTAHLSGTTRTPFPTLENQALTPLQSNLVETLKKEYASHPVSYDAVVLKYSEGHKEAWCADFISWVMRESGSPLVNPNSSHWRIPGVLTLQQYYQATGRYQKASEYTPKLGDVAIYVGKNFYGGSREHANIVLKVEGGVMTTIGGNERGNLRINRTKIMVNESGLVGFGIAEKG